MPPKKFTVGIAGHSGYAGTELAQLLERHPRVSTVLLDHRETGIEPDANLNAYPKRHIPCTAEAAQADGLTLVFLATSHEVSLELAPPLLAADIRVIDMSGAFRLATPERYRRWYGSDHPHPELLSQAQYGLPEFYRALLSEARLVANPGCYPTAANLALRPILRDDLIDRAAGIVCDAKSGVSGAGRRPSLKTSFCEVAGDFSAYAVLDHRHVPEILMHSGMEEAEFSFTAQLLPLERGILETIYFRGVPGLTAAEIHDAYLRAYSSETFVRMRSVGSYPSLKRVARTNFCEIGFRYDESTRRGVIVATIDNLVKGAAGQAIQNMNLALGFNESEGLE